MMADSQPRLGRFQPVPGGQRLLFRRGHVHRVGRATLLLQQLGRVRFGLGQRGLEPRRFAAPFRRHFQRVGLGRHVFQQLLVVFPVLGQSIPGQLPLAVLVVQLQVTGRRLLVFPQFRPGLQWPGSGWLPPTQLAPRAGPIPGGQLRAFPTRPNPGQLPPGWR